MLRKSIYRFIKILFINFLILYILLFVLEIYLQIKNNTFLSESKYYYRERLSDQTNEQVNLAFAPYKILNKDLSLIPLSGISNSRTIFCSEVEGKYHEYKSDEHGFNNKDNDKSFDILLIGDSYVHGLCLDQNLNLSNSISKHNFQVKNLGIMANGPLFEYAIFREYSGIYDFNALVWLFNPDNDFYDFSNEIQNPILQKYIAEKDFSQDLIKKNKIKDEIIKEYLNYDKRKLKETLKHYHIDIKLVRNTISNIISNFSNKSVHEISSSTKSQNNNEDHLQIIYQILEDVNRSLKVKNIDFLVVFNANHPFYKYPKNQKYHNDGKIIIEQTHELQELLRKGNIRFYDFNKYVDINFNENNVDEIFKRVNNPKAFDHYTKNGNAILSAKIIENLRRK